MNEAEVQKQVRSCFGGYWHIYSTVWLTAIPMFFKIRQMIAFIDQEANEKANEIETKVSIFYWFEWKIFNKLALLRLKKNLILKKVVWCSSNGWKSWSFMKRRKSRLSCREKCTFRFRTFAREKPKICFDFQLGHSEWPFRLNLKKTPI